LAEEEIEQMVRDAEANAEADSNRRKMIEVKNEMDSLIYSTEKSLTDHAEKLDEATKQEIEKAIADAKSAKDSDDLEEATKKKDELQAASLKIGQMVYNQKKGAGDDETAEGGNDAHDADFEEKDKKNEK
jgi:molecular chaperone DnaK